MFFSEVAFYGSLFDFHKAFDLTDHNILFNKLLSSGVPGHGHLTF